MTKKTEKPMTGLETAALEALAYLNMLSMRYATPGDSREGDRVYKEIQPIRKMLKTEYEKSRRS